ncbi:MAG: hypothetical protein K5683_06795, partial [Prevotella sp.]|nr:hypothetical protein [Prevotella sp.]
MQKEKAFSFSFLSESTLGETLIEFTFSPKSAEVFLMRNLWTSRQWIVQAAAVSNNVLQVSTPGPMTPPFPKIV